MNASTSSDITPDMARDMRPDAAPAVGMAARSAPDSGPDAAVRALTGNLIEVRGLSKTFTLHQQDSMALPVLEAVDFDAGAGDCLVLSGPSGAGKSTLLRCLYGNYLASSGSIRVRDVHDVSDVHHVPGGAGPDAATGTARDAGWLEMVHAPEQRTLYVRRHLIAYVSQFLRVIPRVSALDVVAEPLLQKGVDRDSARERAAALLRRLNLPERLWSLPPATFSGGEQQRVNIARGFIDDQPIMLLDEPTASLDVDNRAVVIDLIRQACADGRCVIGIFHDESVREAVATRYLAQQPAGINAGATTAAAAAAA